MRIILTLITLCFALLPATSPVAAQSGPLSSATQTLDVDLSISTLSAAELKTRLDSPTSVFEHVSEVGRSGPVAAVLRVRGCQSSTPDSCKMNADIVTYRPDGSIMAETKNLDLPLGRGAVPLKFDAAGPSGVYRVEATVRDLATRRFAKVDRKFGVK
jgi:hypothetical protein